MAAYYQQSVPLIMAAMLCGLCQGWGTVADIQCARLVLSLQPVPLCSQVDWRTYKVVCDISTQEPRFKCKDENCKHLSSSCVPHQCQEVGYARCWPEMTGYWRCGCTPTAFSTDTHLNLTVPCLDAEIFPPNTTREQLGPKISLNGSRVGPGVRAGDLEMCPLGTVVREIRVQFETCSLAANFDDAAVNGVALKCEDPVTGAEKGNVTSATMFWGEWLDPIGCPNGTITGMRIRKYIDFTNYQPANDSLGVNNIEVMCEGALVLGLGNMVGDCAREGDWQPWTHCQDGYAVCGIRTWVQGAAGPGLGNEASSKDDNALTDIQLSCCPVFMS